MIIDFKQLTETEEYKKIIKQMSDDEKRLAEEGARQLLEYFDNEILQKLEALKNKK